MKQIVYFVSLSGMADQERKRREAVMQQFLPEGFQIRISTLPTGPEFLDSHDDFDKAIATTGKHFETFDPKDVDVVILGGALDPGLPQVRKVAKVPVVGPMESSLFIASIAAKPISVVTVDEYAVAATWRGAEQTAVKPEILSVRSMETPVRTIVGDLEAGRTALRRECTAAVREDGAQGIMLGAMTLPTLGLTETLRAELGVPIYDPLRLAINAAVECARSKP